MSDELDSLKTQIARMQASLHVTQTLTLAMFAVMPKQAAALAEFQKAIQDTRDLLMLESDFSDQELEDLDTASDFMSRLMQMEMRKRKKA